MKVIGTFIVVGGVLMGIATLLHPIVVNPWSVLKVLPKTVTTLWMGDHILMLIAISLWLMGLASISVTLKNAKVTSTIANYLFVSSFVIWVLILTMELGVFPNLGHDALTFKHQAYLKTLWSVLFSFGLLSGYGAMILAYLGIFFLAIYLKLIKDKFSWGIYAGLIGTIGIIIVLLKINWAIPVLVITTMPPFVWTLILGGYLLAGKL